MKTVRITIPFLTLLSILCSTVQSEMKPDNPAERAHQFSLTKGQEVVIPAKKAVLPLIVYGDDIGQVGTFVPSGYMGDAGALEVKSAEESVTLKSGAPGVHSLRVSYLNSKRLRSKSSGEGWAGVYWQTPANNWAKIKGAGYDLTGADRVTLWMKGGQGGEIIAEVKIGGLVGPYPDTDLSAIGPVRLTKEWKQFSIPLENKDLRHISGGFAFSLRRADNPNGAEFYIDEIMVESKDTTVAPMPVTSLSPAAGGNKNAQLPKVATETLIDRRTFIIPFKPGQGGMDAEPSLLDSIVLNAVKYVSSKIIVAGHTDASGPAEINQKVSEKRAQMVADYLESRGIAKSRISVEGYGEDRPLVPDTDQRPEEQAKNRRVEVSILPN